jgi:hypothetical protein
MYAMDYKIKIGRWSLMMLDSVKITKSVENLADTATIVIPGTYINKALEIEDKIAEGDAVEIMLGYDGDVKTEFTGYLNSISTDDGTIKLECEDALYLFRQPVADRELKNVGLKSMLQTVAAEVSPDIKVDCSYEFTWEKFVFFKSTALDVLKKVQDETRANIYFAGDTLHIHPPYAEIFNRLPVIYDFAVNIEKSDLKYVKTKDKKIEVEVTVTKPNGEKITQKYGRPGGETIKKTVGSANAGDMKRVAESEYNLWVYDGYEGGFTGWLIPYVEPGYKIQLRDSDYPYKSGDYYVIAVETSFSSSGGSRKINLGRKIG